MSNYHKELFPAIRGAVIETIVPLQSGYLDPVRAVRYIGVSLRTFDGGPAREIPCHRLTQNGKGFYKREDLDEFMRRQEHEVAA